MERFGATKKVPSIAKRLRNMVGTRRLELLTSSVSINNLHHCWGPPRPLQIRVKRSFNGLKNGLDVFVQPAL